MHVSPRIELHLWLRDAQRCVVLMEKTLGFPDWELAFFADQFGFMPTCEIFDAYMKGNVNAISGQCLSSQSLLGEYCGCGSVLLNTSVAPMTPMCTLCPTGESAPLPAKNLNIPSLPFKTCKDLDLAVNSLYEATSKTCMALQSISSLCGCSLPSQDTTPCSLCRNGSRSPTPNATIPLLALLFLGLTPMCAVVEAYMQSLSTEAASCSGLQVFGSYCSCPPVPQSCHDRLIPTCPNNQVPENLQGKELRELSGAWGTPTCTDIFGFLSWQIPSNNLVCYGMKLFSYLCGCGPPFSAVLGLDTVAKQNTSIWLFQVSSLLSILGSSWIIFDSLLKKKKRATTYHQLLVSMIIFDLIGGISGVFGSLPIPVNNQYGNLSGANGARGNDATCTVQGFFGLLGSAGIYYNVALSAYYQLIIINGWKEWQFKKHRLWFHLPPIIVGVGLAFAGIPFYTNDLITCWFPRHPMWIKNVYSLVPISVVIVFVTALMIRVTWFVKQTNQNNQKWKKGTGGGRSALVSKVRWQSIFYTGAFYISWPILIAMYELLDETAVRLDNTFFYFFSFLNPLQGFLRKQNRSVRLFDLLWVYHLLSSLTHFMN